MDLLALKEFVDLGGVFILALVVIYLQQRKLDIIEEQNIKILTLLSVLVKSVTNFNGVDKVLGNSGEAVVNSIINAESYEVTP